MSALARSFRRLRSPQAAVLTLTLVACATAQDPEIDDNGGGTANSPAVGGGGSGSGGSASTGGKGGGLPLAGTTSTPTAGSSTGTGGKPSTGGSTAGGAPATGGTGSTPTAGTSSTGSCPTPYTGTLGATTPSLIFTNGYGQAKTGMWKGYGFTFKYGTATITPGSGTGCFEAAKFCASGTVPAADTAGAGLGWNLSQAQGTSTAAKVAVASAVKISFAGLPAGSRVQLSESATVQYCYTLTTAESTSATIPLTSFKTECWGTTGVAYAGTPVEAIQVVVPGAAAAAKTFDFCVTDIEPG
jgi:hypothetical protein